MYSNIYALPPGHLIVVKDEMISTYDYWELNKIDVDERKTEDEFINIMKQIFFVFHPELIALD